MSEFASILADYLEAVNEARKRKASHDQLRHLFIGFLSKAFQVNYEDIELEKGLQALKVRGFIDLLYQDLIFEFKRDLEMERAKGQEELTRYLSSQPEPIKCFGILTDGIHFEVYILKDEQLKLTDKIELNAHYWQEAQLWLDSYLFAQRNIVPTADDVVRRFGESSAVFVAASQLLREMFSRIQGEPSVKVKFTEWNNLLAKVYGTPVGSLELFIRHTYLSLFARLLAYATLRQCNPESQELIGIVNGQAFKQMGITNLVEQDFFTWVLHPQLLSDVKPFLNALAHHLSSYDLSRINEDLLKELYQQLVDPETRHDLGEFYTPDWLAELTLREAGFLEKKQKSLLDPACGSGTFLFVAIRLLRESGLKGKKLINFAFDNMAGVDVHPLAVTIAKVNFLLALAPDLQGEKFLQLPPIPIYMADSLIKPELGAAGDDIIAIPVSSEDISPTPTRKRSTKRGKERPFGFWIPLRIAKRPQLLDTVIDEMIELARQQSLAEKDLLEGFKQKLGELGVPFSSDWSHNLKLMQKLCKQDRDTIWAFILKNAYRPLYFVQHKFSFCVGNPPWLAYRYIKNLVYKQLIKGLVLRYGLLDRSDVKLFTQMDTSTLFYIHALNEFLIPRGTLAFVMPKSVLTGAKQHAKFQSFGFTKVIDLEDIDPLFKVPAAVLISQHSSEKKHDIPMLVARGKLPKKNLPWQEAKSYLRLEQGVYNPPQALVEPSPYREKFFQGATLVPRSLWFVRPALQGGFGIINPQRPYLETDPEVGAQAKKPWKGIKMEGEVEAKFLYATLLSNHMIPFGYRELSLLVLPIEIVKQKTKTESGRTAIFKQTKLLKRDTALRRGATGLAAWLSKAELEWDNRREEKGQAKTGRIHDIYQRLDYDGNLTRQHPAELHTVIYTATGANITALVISGQTKTRLKVNGLKTQGFIVQHKFYFYESRNSQEAHYLCALLNSNIVNEAIKPYQPRGLYGERGIERRPFEVLTIPIFDKDNAKHQKLAKLSEQCHRKVNKMKLAKNMKIEQLRTEVRRLLNRELQAIDKITREILKTANPSNPSGHSNFALELPLLR